MIEIVSQFNSGVSAVGIGYDSVSGEISVYGAFAANILRFNAAGTSVGSYAVQGGTANDFDLDGVSADFMMNGVLVPAGSMLIFNGESGTVDIIAVNPATGAVIATLATAYGASHVVGGSYNPVTGTFFVVQDLVPGAAVNNQVAQINPATGAVISTFPTDTNGFTVNYGDLDVDPFSGALWVASSNESSLLRMSIDGTVLETFALPAGVGGLSGLAFIPNAPGEAYIVNTGGTVFRVAGIPVVRTGTAGNDVLSGGAGDDQLDGGDGNDTLYGMGGNDYIRGGGAGLDLIYGGDGDDVIVIDSASQIVAGEVYDGGAGDDELQLNFNTDSDLSAVTLAGIESLNQTYFNYDVKLTAAQADAISRFSGQSFTLTSAGTVTMTGGSLNVQTFNLFAASGNNFSLAGATTTYMLTVNGTSFVDTITGSAQGDQLNGGGGNDMLSGGDGNDRLVGGTGADTMNGGLGDDYIYVDNVGDVVIEGSNQGTDRVLSTISFSLAGLQVEELELLAGANINATGNSFANNLIGNSGNNKLNGGAGADRMEGGFGDDIYVVDNIGDTIVEYGGDGHDVVQSSVSYVLPDAVEDLILTGAANINATGNGLANLLRGNGGANILDGGAGADRMEGGLGDDIYYVDHVDDVVFEKGSQGTDEVRTTLRSYTLGANVENLTGSSYLVYYTLTGNSLANVITGNQLDDSLDGKGGADTMIGGLGNDTYYVDNVGDNVVEAKDEGIDWIYSSVSYNLTGRFVEVLYLTGSGNTYAIGNSQDNRLFGSLGNNILRGGEGNDTLYGRAGNDTFAFDTALGPNNIDIIGDFVVADDTIRLSRAILTAIGPNGLLAADAFRIGTAALDADDRIIYNSANGQLFYDADGNGAGAAVQFARLSTGLAMTNADFFIVA